MALGESISKLKVSELKDLAKDVGAEPDGKKKADYLIAIEIFVVDSLKSKKVSELKSMAKDLSINMEGRKKKDEIAEHLQLALDASSIRSIFSVPEPESAAPEAPKPGDKEKVAEELEDIGEELVEIEKDVEVVMDKVKELPVTDMADIYEIDVKLGELVKMNVEYANIGSLLDVGRVKFLDGKYMESMGMLREAVVASDEFFDQYQDVAFAFIIQAAEKILEECRDAKSNDEKAADALIDAKRAFTERGPRRVEATELLNNIASHVYREELELLEGMMAKRESMVKALKVQGVDVFNAERYLHRAKEVFLVGELANCMTYLEKSESMANESKAAWIREIEESVPRVEEIIFQAQEFGANTSEADKHMTQAKTALTNKDYSLCAELTKLAERKAMEGQQGQIQRAAQLEKEKLGDAQKILAAIAPLVQEAQLYRLNTKEIDQAVNSSMSALQANDYVNALTHAQHAENLAKYLRTQIEAEREKIISSGGPFKTCSICGALSVKVFENGWARCMGCGQTYQVISDKEKKKKWGLFGK